MTVINTLVFIVSLTFVLVRDLRPQPTRRTGWKLFCQPRLPTCSYLQFRVGN